MYKNVKDAISTGIDSRYEFLYRLPCIDSTDCIDMRVDYKEVNINDLWNDPIKDVLIDHQKKIVILIFKIK